MTMDYRFRHFSLALVSLGVLQVFLMIGDSSAGFQPMGQFDLGPNELAAMCPMIKTFGDTGEIPPPATVDQGSTPPGECVYYKWVSCQTGGSTAKPCGWYEMTKCDSKRRRKRFAQSYRKPFGPEVLPFIGFAHETLGL